jgi:hypothetical protein
MATSTSKKGKDREECREFEEKWSDLYLFVQIQQEPVCLICNEPVSAMKEYNLKRHYDTKHASKLDTIQGQLRSDEVAD